MIALSIALPIVVISALVAAYMQHRGIAPWQSKGEPEEGKVANVEEKNSSVHAPSSPLDSLNTRVPASNEPVSNEPASNEPVAEPGQMDEA